MENLGLEGQWMHPFHDMQSAVSGLAFLWRSLCMCTKECGKTITPLQAAALKRCRAWPRRAHGCTRVPLYDRFTALWTSHGTVCQMSPHLTFYLFCLYFDLFCFCTNLHGEFLFQNPGFGIGMEPFSLLDIIPKQISVFPAGNLQLDTVVNVWDDSMEACG